MTFALAFAAPTFGGVAGDTGGDGPAGSSHKVLRCPGGWATGGGWPPWLHKVYTRLLATDTPLGERDMRAIVAEVYPETSDQERTAMRSRTNYEMNNIMLARRRGERWVADHSYLDGWSAYGAPVAMNWPPCCPTDMGRAMLLELAAGVPQWPTPLVAIRQLAEVQARAYAASTGCAQPGDTRPFRGRTFDEQLHVGFTHEGRDYFLPPTPFQHLRDATDAQLAAMIGPPLGPEDQNGLYWLVRGPRVVDGTRITYHQVGF